MRSIHLRDLVVVLLGCSAFGAGVCQTSESGERIQTLICALEGSAWGEAAEELVQIGLPAVEPLLDALNGNRGSISVRASGPLSRIQSDRAVQGLIEAVDNKALDRRIRRSILNTLGNIESEGVRQVLIRYLAEEDLGFRFAAIRSLGNIGDEPAQDALIGVLKDENRYVVQRCAGVLGDIGSSRAIVPLIECLEARRGMERIDLMRALVDIGPASVPALVARLDHDMNQEAAWHLVWALGQIGSEVVLDPLVQTLCSDNWMVRNEAAVSLVKIGAPECTAPLRRLLRRGPAHARTEARWVLDALESPQAAVAPASGLSFTGGENAVQVSEGEPLSQITVEGQRYPLCPHRLDTRPPIPSPYETELGHDIVLTTTPDGQYMLMPVTLENGERKGLQQYVNAEDFPTLAQTGFHCEQALDRLRTVTGRSIAEITELARPDRLSTSGFVAEDEDVISVIKGDNRLARKLGLSHAELVKPLFHVLNLIEQNQTHKNYLTYQGHRAEYPPVLYHGKEIRIKVEFTRGGQKSIFTDELDGALAIRIYRDLELAERDYLDRAYAHLSQTERQDLVAKLSSMFVGEMVMYYAKWHGFYEGHTGWRADPITVAFLFGLKDLAQIDAAFDGKLYRVLTEHFTR